MEHVQFIKGSLSDLSDIMSIENAAFDSGLTESIEVYQERLIHFSDGFELMTYFNRVIGFICSELWLETNSLKPEAFQLGHDIRQSHSTKGTDLYISSMGVLPEFRGMGYGRILFEGFIEEMLTSYPQIKSITLIVASEWIHAIKLYEDNGFKLIEKFDAFFERENQGPLDGLVMRKTIE